jgi:hypothetical protein
MIFISHHADASPSATALKSFLIEVMDLSPEKIYLTDLHDREAQSSKKNLERLRFNINESKIVFAIVTQQSIGSGWVLFEPGAAWALGKEIFFIFLQDTDFRDLPEPLESFKSIEINVKNAPIRFMELCRDISGRFKIQLKRGPKVLSALEAMLDVMRRNPEKPAEDFYDESQFMSDAENFHDEGTWAFDEKDYCDITFMADGVTKKEEMTVRLSWDDLFKALAPNIREPRDNEFIESLVLGLCKEKDINLSNGLSYKLLTNPAMRPESFGLIISCFSSRNYIEIARAPHTVFRKNEREVFWKLTQNGEKHLSDVISERRKLHR